MANKTKKIDRNGRAQWHVKDENGGVFGPVDFNTLKEWVVDGRVSPLSQVSNDEQESWSPAVSIADLEMNCVAEIEPGSFYGPIHQRAMAGLVADGSIPADAIVYRRGGSDESTVSLPGLSVITPAEMQLALEFEKKALHEKLRSQNADLEMLRCQIASLCSERDAAVEQVESLRITQASFEKASNDAKKKLSASKDKIAELEDSVSQLNDDYQRRIFSLNNQNLDLQTRETQLNKAAESLRSEISTLRKNLTEQQQLISQQELLYAAELKAKESACALHIDNLAIDHKTAVNLIRHEAAEVSRLLQKEISALQDEVKSLRSQSNQVVTQKNAINIRFEQQKADKKINQSVERKLIVLKQLFVEAASLLRDVEDDADSECEECAASESLDCADGPELLEFEEVEPHESPVTRIYPAEERTEPAARPSERSNRTADTAPVFGSEKQTKAKNNKHWPFGSGKKTLDHRSLAELEAQAHIELQRLSAKGGNISALFDKNK